MKRLLLFVMLTMVAITMTTTSCDNSGINDEPENPNKPKFKLRLEFTENANNVALMISGKWEQKEYKGWNPATEQFEDWKPSHAGIIWHFRGNLILSPFQDSWSVYEEISYEKVATGEQTGVFYFKFSYIGNWGEVAKIVVINQTHFEFDIAEQGNGYNVNGIDQYIPNTNPRAYRLERVS